MPTSHARQRLPTPQEMQSKASGGGDDRSPSAARRSLRELGQALSVQLTSQSSQLAAQLSAWQPGPLLGSRRGLLSLHHINGDKPSAKHSKHHGSHKPAADALGPSASGAAGASRAETGSGELGAERAGGQGVDAVDAADRTGGGVVLGSRDIGRAAAAGEHR